MKPYAYAVDGDYFDNEESARSHASMHGGEVVALYLQPDPLVAELVEALDWLIIVSTLVKYQADNSGKTPYSDWASAVADLEKAHIKGGAVLAKVRP